MAPTTTEGLRKTGEPEATNTRIFANVAGRLAVGMGAASGFGRDPVFDLVRKVTHVAACDRSDVKRRVVVRKATDLIPEVFCASYVIAGQYTND